MINSSVVVKLGTEIFDTSPSHQTNLVMKGFSTRH